MAVNAVCFAYLVDETRSSETKFGLEIATEVHAGLMLNSSVREAA